MSDDFDMDWGPDPFGGDLDFDMDFDSAPKQKGKLRSFASGFLSGVKDSVNGDTDARLKTLRTVLPKSYSNFFNTVNEANNLRKAAMEEMKADSIDAVKDLQYIAGRSVESLRKFAPNNIANGVESFSQRDFSHWESNSSHGDNSPSVGEASDDDVNRLLESTQASEAQRNGLMVGMTDTITKTLTSMGGRQIGTLEANNKQLSGIHLGIKQLVQFQQKVQSRNDQMKISLLARIHVTNAKYYKFQESAQHRLITEMKNLVKYSQMSDFEKTSFSQGARKSMRDNMFSTVTNKLGGVKNWAAEKFGRANRKDIIDEYGGMAGDIRMGLEMSEGMPVNLWEMGGRMAGEALIDKIPDMLRSPKGKEMVRKLMAKNPALARQIKKKYGKLEDMGNTLSYAAGNIEGLTNTLAKHYRGEEYEDEQTYDDYVNSLPPGKKPLSKAIWWAAQKGKAVGKKSLNNVLEDVYGSSGTSYSMKRRSLKEGANPFAWSVRSDRTLNEIIPMWMSKLHNSIEKMRTGDDSLKPETFDYVRGRFLTAKQAESRALNLVFNKRQLTNQADAAKGLAKQIDTGGTLSQDAHTAFATQLAQDTDKGLGFSPYNYLQMENDGHSPKIAEEIRQLMRDNFGITDDHADKFFQGSDIDRAAMLTRLPTKKGRKLANDVTDSAKYLSGFTPNIADQIDELRNNGFEPALRAAGIIKSKNGVDEIDTSIGWDKLKQIIGGAKVDTNDNDDIEDTPGKTRKFGGKTTIVNQGSLDTSGLQTAIQSLTSVFTPETMQSLATFAQTASKGLDLTPLTSQGDETLKRLDALLGLANTRNETLEKLLLRAPSAPVKDPRAADREEGEAETAKKGLFDRIKQVSPRNLFNKGVETLMKNQPLVLGGMLGGLVGLGMHDPKMAMLLGAGAIAATGYQKLKSLSQSAKNADNEDLYEEGSNDPILEARKLKNGDYYDATKGFLIKSWNDIVGTVKDITTGIYIAGTKLAKKLFTKENKEVLLRGMDKLRSLLVKAFNFVDPIGRMKKMGASVMNRVYQMDVYKEGDDSPTLIGKKFATGAYYRKDDTGNAVPLKGWNEIDGAVYNAAGECIITEDEYERGLKTSAGMSINKLGALVGKGGTAGLGFLKTAGNYMRGKGNEAYDKTKALVKADYSPIVNSVDRIYALLCKHFGVPLDSTVLTDVVKEEATKMNTTKIRANSLADKASQAKAKKEDKMKDSIIKIADTMTGGPKDDGKKKKGTGFWGSMFGAASGLLGMGKSIFTSIIGPTFTNGFKMLFSFAGMGLKVVPLIAKGIGGIATGIGGIAKFLAKIIGGGGGEDSGPGIDDLLDGGDDGDEGTNDSGRPARRTKSQKRKDRLKYNRRNKTWHGKLLNKFSKVKSKVPGFLKGGIGKNLLRGGAAAAVGYASSALADSGLVDPDGATGHVLNGVSTAATVYGTAQTALSVAGLFGVEATMGGLAASAAGGLGTAATFAAPLLFNPITLGIVAAGLVGYGLYKWMTKPPAQLKIRMAQYGLTNADSDFAKKILECEDKLTKFVVISNGKANFAQETPVRELFSMFVKNPDNKKEIGDFFTWFNGRFKPVYLTYMSSLDTVGMKSLVQYDKDKTVKVYQVAQAVHNALLSQNPCPYDITAPVDKDVVIATRGTVMPIITDLMKELKEDRHSKSAEGVAEANLMKGTGDKADLLAEKAKLMETLKKPSMFGWFGGTTDLAGAAAAHKRLDEINSQIDNLNKSYTVGDTPSSVSIKDLLPPGKDIDILTAVRLAAYGNDANVPWRVEAVLRLERYTEKFIKIIGDDVRFTGKTGDIYAAFKDAFQIEKGDAANWATWFRDRFLPVLMAYVRKAQEYRKGLPKDTWLSFTATAKSEIANEIVKTHQLVGKRTYVIWDILSSPFRGARSCRYSKKIPQYLKALAERANAAKLKDPLDEAAKTSNKAQVDKTTTHAVGGKATVYNAPKLSSDRFGQSLTSQDGSGYSTGQNNGMYATDDFYKNNPLDAQDYSGNVNLDGVVPAGGGNDNGVSIPKKTAEQLIIKEMLAQGFKDPRAIAQMLALCSYESGGFQRTTENMKYTDPKRLVSLFKEIRTEDQARRLIAAGPQAIANVVYGGGKGASLGNIAPGDGWLYRGRGLVQLTGKANYARIGQEIGVDLVNHPELASNDPSVMAKIAVAFYRNSKQLQSITSNNNFGYSALGLNGGNALPGMDKRFSLFKDYLAKLGSGDLKPESGPQDPATPNAPSPGGAPGGTPPGVPGAPAGGGGTAPQTGPSPGQNTQAPFVGGGGMSAPPSMAGGAAGQTFNNAMAGVNQAMGNRVNDYTGLKVKSGETTGGGPVHPGLKRLAELIQNKVPNFNQFTALNDEYHQTKPGNSKHKIGLALDFTLSNGVAGSEQAIAVVKQIMTTAGLSPNEYYILNEYKQTTKNTTGGHVHVNFNSDESAAKFLGKSGASLTAPAGIDRTPPPGAIPPAVNTPAQSPAATGPAGVVNTPAPEPTAAAPATSAPAAPAPVTQQPAGPGGVDLTGLSDTLAKAIASGDTAQVQLLQQIVQQLQALNQSMATKAPAVKLS